MSALSETSHRFVGDASKYTAELTIPQSTTNTKATITVSAGSAQVANSNPAILGPEEDTSRTFEIAAPTSRRDK